jgi:TPR repeat protein
MPRVNKKGVAQMCAGVVAAVAVMLLTGTAYAEGVATVFRPPTLDYKKVCKSQILRVVKLDRDWTAWNGTKIDIPMTDALSLISEYTNGSDRIKQSPQTSLKMLAVLTKQYPASRSKFARPTARALIEGATNIEDLKKAEALLLKIYDTGDIRAAYSLGQLYGSRGPSEMRDLTASQKYLQRAAAGGDVDGQLAYARLLASNEATMPIEKTTQVNNALVTLVGRVQQGDCSNMDEVGYLYMNGELVQKNVDVGLEWFERFAETGSASAAEFLAGIYKSSKVDELNIQKSTQFLLQAADAGRPSAAFNIGKLYATGVTLEKNRDKAIAYLQSAFNGKVEGAGYWLARIYSGDFDFKPEPEKAKAIYAQLVSNPKAAADIREAYGKFLGKYGSTDVEVDEAIGLLVKSANAGSGAAARDVGDIYYALADKDVTKYPLAEKYFRLAARLGEAHGASRIADMYSCGAGLPVSVIEANRWRLQAANLGSDRALWLAGLRGISTADPKDQDKGRLFVRQASLRGSADAIGYIVSRLEKGVDGFAQDLEQANRLLKFVDQNTDPVFKHDAQLAIIGGRFDVAKTTEESQAQLSAIEPFVASGDAVAAIKKTEMLDQAGIGKPEAISLLLKVAAEGGDTRGMRDYGKFLLGDTKNDVNIGRQWIEKAANAGDIKSKLQFVDVGAPTALDDLDRIASSGHVCSVDHMVSLATKYVAIPDPAGATQAKFWLENASAIVGQDSGDLFAIAAAYRDGVAGASERYRAEDYFMRSLALGRKSAARDLAEGHLNKYWTVPDPVKAKTYLLGLLNAGDVFAGNKLLGEYADSTIPATNAEVDDVIEKLQGQMRNPAKYLLKLARLNEANKLGPKDEALAVKWLIGSAAAGEPNSMYRVYNAYINGVGVERSVPQGIEWLQKSADAGNYKAAEGLAAAYETGFGLEKDPVKSKYWKDKAKELKAL